MKSVLAFISLSEISNLLLALFDFNSKKSMTHFAQLSNSTYRDIYLCTPPKHFPFFLLLARSPPVFPTQHNRALAASPCRLFRIETAFHPSPFFAFLSASHIASFISLLSSLLPGSFLVLSLHSLTPLAQSEKPFAFRFFAIALRVCVQLCPSYLTAVDKLFSLIALTPSAYVLILKPQEQMSSTLTSQF